MKFKTIFYSILICIIIFSRILNAGYIGLKTIFVDQNPSDWTNVTGEYPVPGTNMAIVTDNQYIWQDPYGDDTGDGDYLYPTNSTAFNPSSADIDQFRVCWDNNNVYILIRAWNANAEWFRNAEIIGICTNLNTGSAVLIEGDGTNPDNGPTAELRSTKIKCDFVLFLATTYKGWLWNNATGTKIGDASNSADDGTLNNFSMADIQWNEYEISIPTTLIGSPKDKTWYFIVGWGFEENNYIREVQPYNGGDPMEWYPCNGDNTWWDNLSVDPDVMDLIGAPLNQQVSDLSSYNVNGTSGNASDFVDIQYSYVTVADYYRFVILPTTSFTCEPLNTQQFTALGATTTTTGAFLSGTTIWSVYNNIGTIDSSGIFTATNTTTICTGYIVASRPNITSSTIRITVIPDTNTPAPVYNFSVTPSEGQLILDWNNPTTNEDGSTLLDYVGTKVVRNTNSYPTNVTDGIVVYDGTATSYIDKDVIPGTTYYYTAFAYDDKLPEPNYSKAVPSAQGAGVPKKTIEADTIKVIPNKVTPDIENVKIYVNVKKEDTITLYIYDLKGRSVKTITQDVRPGIQKILEWDKRDERTGKYVGSGIYIIYIKGGGIDTYIKMVVIN